MIGLRFHVSHAIAGRTGGQVGPCGNLARRGPGINRFSQYDPQARSGSF
jgi:hypothetical protein